MDTQKYMYFLANTERFTIFNFYLYMDIKNCNYYHQCDNCSNILYPIKFKTYENIFFIIQFDTYTILNRKNFNEQNKILLIYFVRFS